MPSAASAESPALTLQRALRELADVHDCGRLEQAPVVLRRSARLAECRKNRTTSRHTMLSRKQPWKWTKEEDERLRAFVAKGASFVKAAAALKRKIVSVRTRARALGCPFQPLRV